MTSSYINDGRPRTVTFTHDISGQVIDRDEADNNTNAGDPRAVSYRFGGKEMGSINNDGGFNQNYADSIADRTITPNTAGTGAFRHGDTSGETVTDFDNSYEAINSYGQGSTAGSYVVRGGESLSAIAANVYGDSSLWYKIAQINGLGGADAALTAGTTLSLPAGVTRNTYNAATFQPYNPGEAIGDVSPTTPEPPKENEQKCGVFGQILTTVVAVAVTVATGNAVLGNLASQAVGLATGIQDKFNWKSLGMAYVTQGLSKVKAIGDVASAVTGTTEGLSHTVATAALTNAAAQGIGVVTGLQDRFSWTGVAAAGVSAGAGFLATKYIPGGATDIDGVKTDASFGHQMGARTVTALANAATRSALDGNNFGDNLIAAIPDVIGQTIGDGLRGHASGSNGIFGDDGGGILGDAVRGANKLTNGSYDVIGSVADSVAKQVSNVSQSAKPATHFVLRVPKRDFSFSGAEAQGSGLQVDTAVRVGRNSEYAQEFRDAQHSNRFLRESVVYAADGSVLEHVVVYQKIDYINANAEAGYMNQRVDQAGHELVELASKSGLPLISTGSDFALSIEAFRGGDITSGLQRGAWGLVGVIPLAKPILKGIEKVFGATFKAVSYVGKKAGEQLLKAKNVTGEAVKKLLTFGGKMFRNPKYYEDLAVRFTVNPDSTVVVLGKSYQDGIGYAQVGFDRGATYFKVLDWSKFIQKHSVEETWQVNQAFIEQQLTQGKEIILSHNPAKASGFFSQEVAYIENRLNFIENGYTWQKSGNMWRVK